MEKKKKITPVDEWQVAITKHIAKLNEDEKREFAHKIIFDTALEVGINGYEIVGILEVVKLNLLDHLNNIEENDCDGDCDNCDLNKENE